MKFFFTFFLFFHLSLGSVELNQKMADIEKLIFLSQQNIHELLLKSYELEIDAQNSFFVNWSDYITKLEQSEKYKLQASKIEKNMMKLQQELLRLNHD